MPAARGRGIWGLLQRQELIAEIDEGHARLTAAQFEGEELRVEVERFVDIADLDRDMVEADKARLVGAGLGSPPLIETRYRTANSWGKEPAEAGSA
jgi:hypothetical protein